MPGSRPRSLTGLVRAAWRRKRLAGDLALVPRLSFDPSAPALLLSPHWDDAVLSCWSLLAAGDELTVVNVFAAIPPPGGGAGAWEALLGLPDAAARARLRAAEDARALALAGRTPVDLPLLDHQLRLAHRTGPIQLSSIDRALTARVTAAAHVYVPAAIGGHPDHVLVRRYGQALARAGVPVSAYAELPYATAHGWPSWVAGAEQEEGDVDAYWSFYLRAIPEAGDLRGATVESVDGAAWAAKAKAVSMYVASLNRGVRRGVEDPAIGGFEVRWELVGAAAGAGFGGTQERR